MDDSRTAEVLYSTGDHPFGEVSAVELLEDGGLAVADAQADHIAIFDEQGQLVDSIGGKGDGPGELSGLETVIQLPGGSLAALSHSNRRVTVFGDEPQTFTVEHRFLMYPAIGQGPSLYGRAAVAGTDSLEWHITRYDLSQPEAGSTYDVIDFSPGGGVGPERDAYLYPYEFGAGTTLHFNRHGDYAYLTNSDTTTVIANLDTGEAHRLPLPNWRPIERDMGDVERVYEIWEVDPPSSLGVPVLIQNIHLDDQGRVWYGRTARVQSALGDSLTAIVWDPDADGFTTVVFPIPYTGMTDRYPFMVRGQRAAVVSIDEYGRQAVHVVKLP